MTWGINLLNSVNMIQRTDIPGKVEPIKSLPETYTLLTMNFQPQKDMCGTS